MIKYPFEVAVPYPCDSSLDASSFPDRVVVDETDVTTLPMGKVMSLVPFGKVTT